MQLDQLKRRAFISLLPSAAAVWPLAARAQPGQQMRRIGVLMGVGEHEAEARKRALVLKQGLHSFGWTDGQNARITYCWGAGDAHQINACGIELANLAPEVILTTSTPTTRAVQPAAARIPIVFVSVSDPVGDGFVASLAAPGGNITGFSNYEPAMVGKWLQLLKEISPRIARAALLFNPDTAPHSIFLPAIAAAARTFPLEVIHAPVRQADELEGAITSIARRADVGLVTLPDTFTFARRSLVASLVNRYRLPAVFPFREFTVDGGLISYGTDLTDQLRRATIYVDRILRGARPADLPVQAPTKFELVINLRTANALRLELPPTLLARADEVIE